MKKISIAIVVLLFAVASCSKKTAGTSTAPAAPVGTKIFAGNCAGCHGPEGVSDGNVNLQTTQLDKAGLIHVITNGHGHMPAFQDKLSAAEISAVADLIVSWHK